MLPASESSCKGQFSPFTIIGGVRSRLVDDKLESGSGDGVGEGEGISSSGGKAGKVFSRFSGGGGFCSDGLPRRNQLKRGDVLVGDALEGGVS